MTDNAAARMSDSPVVAVINQKGGVGKSTLCLGLCAYTGQTHGAALLVDCDPQATAYDVTEALDNPGYELVAVDCPGSLEGHDVLGVVLRWTDFALIPYDHEVTTLPPTVKTARYCE